MNELAVLPKDSNYELSRGFVNSWRMMKIGRQIFHLNVVDFRPDFDGVSSFWRVEISYIAAGPMATFIRFTHLALDGLDALHAVEKELKLIGAKPWQTNT